MYERKMDAEKLAEAIKQLDPFQPVTGYTALPTWIYPAETVIVQCLREALVAVKYDHNLL